MSKVHKAQYSDTIVQVIRAELLERYPEFWQRPKLWDPFAGPGLKLAQIAGSEFDYGGTELEESFIVDPNIVCGSATQPDLYPTKPYVIVTSPAYPNGMADHHEAKDDSTRNTYRAWVAQIEGHDRELHELNMGRYGYRGTKRDGKSIKRATYWGIAGMAVENWQKAELVILNVSDFISNGEVEPHANDWIQLMIANQWIPQTVRAVPTPRLGYGANHDARVEHEFVIICKRQW